MVSRLTDWLQEDSIKQISETRWSQRKLKNQTDSPKVTLNTWWHEQSRNSDLAQSNHPNSMSVHYFRWQDGRCNLYTVSSWSKSGATTLVLNLWDGYIQVSRSIQQNSAQNFRKPTVILQHLLLKAGKQWLCSCSLGSNSIQLSLDREEKTWTRKSKQDWVHTTYWVVQPMIQFQRPP